MKTVNLKIVMKKCTLYYTYVGVGIGVVMFFVCTFNHSVPFYINEKAYYGIIAGLLGLIFSPIIAAIVGFFHSIILWFPIIWIYRKISYKVRA